MTFETTDLNRRAEVAALLRSGWSKRRLARESGIRDATLRGWMARKRMQEGTIRVIHVKIGELLARKLTATSSRGP